MIKQRIIILAVIGLVALVPFAVIASDIDNANWLTRIRSANSGSEATDIWQTFSLSTEDMISVGMLNGTATDAAMKLSGGDDVAFMPSLNSTYPWVVEIPSIGASSQVDLYLYSGNVTGGELRYFPDGDGMTVTDSDTLEIGDNFTIEQKGWIDTDNGSDKNLVYKPEAFRTYISGTSNITSELCFALTLDPDGEGSASERTVVGGATGWQVSSDDSDATYTSVPGVSSCDDLYTAENQTAVGDIDSVTLWIRHKSSTYSMYALVKTHATVYAYDEGVEGAWHDSSEVLANNPNTGVPWTWDEVNNMEIGVRGTQASSCAKVWAVISGHLDVTAESVLNGEYTVTTTADTDNLTISVVGASGTFTDTTALGSVTTANTTYDWVFCENDAMPYMEYTEITIDAAQAGKWEWEYAATFEDQSINDNIAYPTFRTASSNEDVILTIQSQVSLLEGEEPSTQVTGGWVMIGEVPTEPPNLFIGGGTSFPGGAEIETLAEDTLVPYVWWITWIAFASALGIAAWVYSKTHNTKLGKGGSLFIMWLTFTIVIVIWYIGGGGVIPGWVLIPTSLWGILLMIWFNPYRTAAS